MKITPEIDAEIRRDVVPMLAKMLTRREKTRAIAHAVFVRLGELPSANIVRGYTDHGSTTDILRDLEVVRNELRTKVGRRVDTPDMPEDLGDLASDLFSRMWSSSMERALETLSSERQKLDGERATMEERVRQADLLRSAADRQSEALGASIEEERNRRAEAEQQAVALQTEREALQQRLDEAHARLEAEKAARLESEKRFSDDLEKEREAARRNEEILDGEIRFAKMQIEDARSRARELSELLKRAQDEKILEIEVWRRDNRRMADEKGVATLALGEANGKIESLEKAMEALQSRLNAEMTRRESLENAMASMKARARAAK